MPSFAFFYFNFLKFYFILFYFFKIKIILYISLISTKKDRIVYIYKIKQKKCTDCKINFGILESGGWNCISTFKELFRQFNSLFLFLFYFIFFFMKHFGQYILWPYSGVLCNLHKESFFLIFNFFFLWVGVYLFIYFILFLSLFF